MVSRTDTASIFIATVGVFANGLNITVGGGGVLPLLGFAICGAWLQFVLFTKEEKK